MGTYLNLDADGYVLSVAQMAECDLPYVESLDGFDMSGVRIRAHRWDGERLTLDEARLAELLAAEQAKEDAEARQERIAALKDKLAATDYAVIKIAEGAATAEEYADVIARRRAWRAEINGLEAAYGG